jgi:predicted transcriptional regulator
MIEERRRSAMATKRTMTLNLTDAEMQVLEELSRKKDLTKTAILRQALRLYQLLDVRMERGEKMYLEDESKGEKSEVMVL